MKNKHIFDESPTVSKFRMVMASEMLDSQNIPKGTKLYVRKEGVGCWHVDKIVIEDSAVYIEAGDDGNDVKIMEDV